MQRVTMLLAVLTVSLGADCESMPVGQMLPVPSVPTRIHQIGDSYEYRFEEKGEATGGGVLEGSGMSRTYYVNETDERYGDVVVAVVQFQETITRAENIPNVQVGDMRTSSARSIYVREPSGRLRWIGNRANNETSYIADPEGGVPPDEDNIVNVGDTYSVSYTTEDGFSESYSEIVTAVEQISVTAGTFTTFRIEFTRTGTPEDSPSGLISQNTLGTVWFVPYLGMNVKQEIQRSDFYEDKSSSNTITTLELLSTNVGTG